MFLLLSFGLSVGFEVGQQGGGYRLAGFATAAAMRGAPDGAVGEAVKLRPRVHGVTLAQQRNPHLLCLQVRRRVRLVLVRLFIHSDANL